MNRQFLCDINMRLALRDVVGSFCVVLFLVYVVTFASSLLFSNVLFLANYMFLAFLSFVMLYSYQ